MVVDWSTYVMITELNCGIVDDVCVHGMCTHISYIVCVCVCLFVCLSVCLCVEM